MSLTVAPSYALAFVLVMARMGGFFMLAPVFNSRMFPTKVKAFLLIAFSACIVPTVPHDQIPQATPIFALLLVKEMLVGLALAFAISIVFTAVQMAGSLLDMQVGFAMMQLLDPLIGAPVSVLGQFYYLFGALIFFILDGHHMMIAGLAHSFSVLPLTAFPSTTALFQQILISVSQLFVIAMQIAAPVFVAAFITDIALGLVVRAVTQMNIFAVGMPVKILVGLTAVYITLPAFFLFFGDRLDVALTRMSDMALAIAR